MRKRQRRFVWLRSRCLRAFVNPTSNGLDLLGPQLLGSLGHFSVANALVMQALRAIAGHDGRPGVAAVQDQLRQSDIKTSLARVRFTVTLEARGLKNRSHVALKHEFVRARHCSWQEQRHE